MSSMKSASPLCISDTNSPDSSGSSLMVAVELSERAYVPAKLTAACSRDAWRSFVSA